MIESVPNRSTKITKPIRTVLGFAGGATMALTLSSTARAADFVATCASQIVIANDSVMCTLYDVRVRPAVEVKTESQWFPTPGAIPVTMMTDSPGSSATTTVIVYPDIAGDWTVVRNGDSPLLRPNYHIQIRLIRDFAPATNTQPFHLKLQNQDGGLLEASYKDTNSIYIAAMNAVGQIDNQDGYVDIIFPDNLVWRKMSQYSQVSELTATPAARAAQAYSQKVGSDVLRGPWKNEDQDALANGYAYQVREWIADDDGLTTPENVMESLEDDPNSIFPFTVASKNPEYGDENAAIKNGAVLDLQNVRFPGDSRNFVQVEDVTPTQFTFRTLAGHFDGVDALISFRVYENAGAIYLEQTAFAPNSGKMNAQLAGRWAPAVTWQNQAENLRKAVHNKRR